MPVFQMRGKGSMMSGYMVIPLLVMGADSICDLRKREIYPVLTFVGILAGVCFQLFAVRAPFGDLILSLIPGGMVLFASVLTGGQIGKGDALVLLMTGAWTDMWTAWQTLLFGSLFTAAFAVIRWTMRRKNEEIPFVPFLFTAMLFSFLM